MGGVVSHPSHPPIGPQKRHFHTPKSYRNKRTLNRILRPQRTQRPHRTNHKILEHLRPRLAAFTSVRGEGRHLGGVVVALEGAVERGGRGAAGLHGGCAGSGERVRGP
jgi:hypothetical protein